MKTAHVDTQGSGSKAHDDAERRRARARRNATLLGLAVFAFYAAYIGINAMKGLMAG